MRLLYSSAIYLYHFFIWIASPFYSKAKTWQKGRKNWAEKLEQVCNGKEHTIVFHCASLGEFEQGKPLMEKIRSEKAEAHILVTFFSPSGYEIKKDDPIADAVVYLPIDTPANARKFVEIVRPEALFFIKYEFWFNLMHQLAKNQIPFYFASTIFRKSQLFFKPWGRWFAKRLKEASSFFVQNEESKKLLHSIGIHQVEITGDTRFDRVNEIAKQSVPLDFMTHFQTNSELIIAGSTWPPDEQLLARLLHMLPDYYKLVIAPHQIDEKHIREIEHLFEDFKTVRYSNLENKNSELYQVLIVDTIGLLNKLYGYGRVAYIGGAFKTGLHNILEAVVFGIPVFFGTKYQKFNEAVELVNRQGAFPVNNSDEMLEKMLFFDRDHEEYDNISLLCRQYVEENLGAAERIVKRVFSDFG